MVDPLFWLGLSILLVAVSLAAVLVAALPAFRELARAARSAEKLFDTLNRELPPTLESIRLTSMEITELKGDVSQGVQSAGQVVQQVDQGISGAKKQAQQAQTTTRSFVTGFKAAWQSFKESSPAPRKTPPSAFSASPDEAAPPQLEAAESQEMSIGLPEANPLPASPPPSAYPAYPANPQPERTPTSDNPSAPKR